MKTIMKIVIIEENHMIDEKNELKLFTLCMFNENVKKISSF